MCIGSTKLFMVLSGVPENHGYMDNYCARARGRICASCPQETGTKTDAGREKVDVIISMGQKVCIDACIISDLIHELGLFVYDWIFSDGEGMGSAIGVSSTTSWIGASAASSIGESEERSTDFSDDLSISWRLLTLFTNNPKNDSTKDVNLCWIF